MEIRTDAGIIGWGEGASTPSQAAIDTCLVGKDPFDIEVIWNTMHQGRSNAAAISGVDIALWDIVGKAVGSTHLSTSRWCIQESDTRLCHRTVQKRCA